MLLLSWGQGQLLHMPGTVLTHPNGSVIQTDKIRVSFAASLKVTSICSVLACPGFMALTLKLLQGHIANAPR